MAYVILQASWSDSTSGLLLELHWLPIRRVILKLQLSPTRRNTLVCRHICQTTCMTTNQQGRFGHLQHSYFNNYDVSPPSHLVPLPSLLLTSGIHSLYKLNPLTVSKLSNVDRKLSYSFPLTPLKTVQRHLSTLFLVSTMYCAINIFLVK